MFIFIFFSILLIIYKINIVYTKKLFSSLAYEKLRPYIAAEAEDVETNDSSQCNSGNKITKDVELLYPTNMYNTTKQVKIKSIKDIILLIINCKMNNKYDNNINKEKAREINIFSFILMFQNKNNYFIAYLM